MRDFYLYYEDDGKTFKGFKYMWCIGLHIVCACEDSWYSKDYSDLHTGNGQP